MIINPNEQYLSSKRLIAPELLLRQRIDVEQAPKMNWWPEPAIEIVWNRPEDLLIFFFVIFDNRLNIVSSGTETTFLKVISDCLPF